MNFLHEAEKEMEVLGVARYSCNTTVVCTLQITVLVGSEPISMMGNQGSLSPVNPQHWYMKDVWYPLKLSP